MHDLYQTNVPSLAELTRIMWGVSIWDMAGLYVVCIIPVRKVGMQHTNWCVRAVNGAQTHTNVVVYASMLYP